MNDEKKLAYVSSTIYIIQYTNKLVYTPLS